MTFLSALFGTTVKAPTNTHVRPNTQTETFPLLFLFWQFHFGIGVPEMGFNTYAIWENWFGFSITFDLLAEKSIDQQM